MKEIKPTLMDLGDGEGGYTLFDPMSVDGIKLRCVCGYELLRESKDTWACTGGNHRYLVSQGQVTYDKHGNVMLKIPTQKKK